jgi:transcriptional regulator with XRE-family HTH domain
MYLGKRIKELREERELLQRQLAARLDMDTPLFSKIERGERRAKREQVVKLAELSKADPNELLTLWLSDQISELVKDEANAENALNLVIKNVRKE